MISTKSFPWICGNCHQREVRMAVVPYALQVEYEGTTIEVVIPDLETPCCEQCGTIMLDDRANRRITEEIRRHFGLLTPEQIRRNRESIGQSREQLAAHLGLSESTLTRWESGGQLQQRAMDRLLRLYFVSPEARVVLADENKLHEPEQVSASE